MALLQKGYLGSTPLWKNKDWFEDGAYKIVNSSAQVTLTANSSAHTKGSYSQVIASTSANSSFLFVQVYNINTSATNTAVLLDIATGSAGSETNIASNIAVGGAAATAGLAGLFVGLPVKIASGTRISARIQSVVTGGKTAAIVLNAIDAGDYNTAPTSVDVIGGNTSTSQGISFSGSSGTWVEATASTSQAYRAVGIVCSVHDSDAANVNSATYEVGVGGAGSEISFGSTRFTFTSSEQSGNEPPFSYLFGRNIPAGSRLAVKHNIAANPSKYGFCLIGIP